MKPGTIKVRNLRVATRIQLQLNDPKLKKADGAEGDIPEDLKDNVFLVALTFQVKMLKEEMDSEDKDNHSPSQAPSTDQGTENQIKSS